MESLIGAGYLSTAAEASSARTRALHWAAWSGLPRAEWRRTIHPPALPIKLGSVRTARRSTMPWYPASSNGSASSYLACSNSANPSSPRRIDICQANGVSGSRVSSDSRRRVSASDQRCWAMRILASDSAQLRVVPLPGLSTRRPA